MIIIFLLTAVILQVYYYCLYIYVQGCRSGTNFLSMQDMGLDGLYIYMYGLAHLVTPESLKTLFHWCFFSFMWLRADLTSRKNCNVASKLCEANQSLAKVPTGSEDPFIGRISERSSGHSLLIYGV